MTDINMDIPLFKNSFDKSIWKNDDRIDYLILNITKIENVVEKYLCGIKSDFPNLTDHSLTHSKMLWNYANVIVGNKIKYLNPLEAFILHISFLIHDSGMCFSILNNKEEIEKDNFYTDFLKEHGTNNEVKKEALFHSVRIRHGDFALRVATEKLKEDEYLIEDIKIREELGLIIGKIAKSHTCNINYIEREFGPSYCNPYFPTTWAIDCQKLSFILRTADAAHIDNLRTPKTYKMISEIPGISKEHWTFQKKIGFPVLSEDNMLMYSSNTPFNIGEQKAWWFCFDALQNLDKELKNANEYFEIKKQESFSARGVKSIYDTIDLGKKYIRTDGWNSIDTKVKVTNPVHIASELGGVKLYGNIHFAIRELVQNSIDAVNLYRIQTGQEYENVGEIKLSIEKKDGQYFLLITDSGIGMSQTLMTNELLDFGGSFWKSSRFNFEYEGAKTKGFEAIGKFGIGFFSVFMLGDQITVTSWKFGESIENMKTLDFYDGLFSNPILRTPTTEEKTRIIDRGTSIKIKLKIDPYLLEGFIGNSQFVENKLYTLAKFFIPSANVKISIKEIDGAEASIPPSFIYSLKLKELYDFVNIPRANNHQNQLNDLINEIKLELIEISDSKRVYGKLVLFPQLGPFGITSTALILSKGIRISEIGGFAGYVVTDEIVSIKRDAFTQIIPFEVLKKWAIQQKKMIEDNNLINLYNVSYFGLIMTFNLFDENMPIALSKKNNQYFYVSIKQFKDHLMKSNEIKFHIEGHSQSSRLIDCDGFITLQHRFSINNIVKQEEQSSLTNYKDLLNKTIKEVWPDYKMEEDNLLKKGGYYLELPYMVIEKYIRI